MIITSFDIEVTKVFNGGGKPSCCFLIGAKRNDSEEIKLFDNVLSFREYAKNSVCVGFNVIDYDFVMMSIAYIMQVEMGTKKEFISQVLYLFNDIIINTGDFFKPCKPDSKLIIIGSIFQQLAILEDYFKTLTRGQLEDCLAVYDGDLIDKKECLNLICQLFTHHSIKKQHPVYNVGELLNEKGRLKSECTRFYELRDIPNLRSGSLKVRSLQSGDREYLETKILEFNKDLVFELDELENYARADIRATENLALKYQSSISACLTMLDEFNITKQVLYLSPVQISRIVWSKGDNINPEVYKSRIKFDKEGNRINPQFYKDWFDSTTKFLKSNTFRIFNKDKSKLVMEFELSDNDGGLHFSRVNTVLEEDCNGYVIDFDYKSLYPYCMVSDACPIFNNSGKQTLINSLRLRDEKKQAGDIGEQAYKLFNNSTYGLLTYLCKNKGGLTTTLKEYEHIGNYVTVLAQEAILKFISYLGDNFTDIKITNVNTDGVFCKISGVSKEEITAVIENFNKNKQAISPINMTFYKKIIVLNTNNYLKIDSVGNHVVKGNSFLSHKVNRKQGIKFPVLLNFADILKEFLQICQSDGIQLDDFHVLDYIKSCNKLTTEPLFFSNGQGTRELYGKFLSTNPLKSGSFNSKNFSYTGGLIDNDQLIKDVLYSFFLNFFSYDSEGLKDSFEQGCVYSSVLFGSDFTRQSSLKDHTNINKPHIFCGKLITLLSNNFKFNTSGMFSKLKDTDKVDPLSLIKRLTAGKVEQLTSIYMKSLTPKVIDLDFKNYNLKDIREECIKDIMNIKEVNPSLIIYGEWFAEFNASSNKGNGIHLVVRDGVSRIKDFREFLCKYDTYIDKDRIGGNITLYASSNEHLFKLGRELVTINNLAYLSSYTKLFVKRFITDKQKDVEGGSDLIIKRFSEARGQLSDFIDIYAGKTQDESLQKTLRYLLQNCGVEFSERYQNWVEELVVIRNMYYHVLSRYHISDNEMSQLLYNFLIKLCVECKKTGAMSNNFQIAQVTSVCEFYANNWKGYTSSITKLNDKDIAYEALGLKDNKLDFTNNGDILLTLFEAVDNQDKNITETVNRIDILSETKENLYYNSPTGEGKTQSIIQQILVLKYRYDYDLYPHKTTVLYIAPTKLELENFVQRIKQYDNSIKWYNFTSETKRDSVPFDYKDEGTIPDVIIMTSAYLGMRLQNNLRTFLIEREGKIISIIDEFDKSIEFCLAKEVIKEPVKIKNNVLTSNDKDLIDVMFGSDSDQVYNVKSLIDSLSCNIRCSKYQGYISSDNRGSCFTLERCITDSEHLYYVSGDFTQSSVHLGELEKDTFYTNTVAPICEKRPIDLLKGEVICDLDECKVVKLDASEYKNIPLLKSKYVLKYISNCYISKVIRCKSEAKYKFIFNTSEGKQNKPCGTYTINFLYTETLAKLINHSKKTVGLSATDTLFLKDNILDKFDFKSKFFIKSDRLIDDITVLLHYNSSIDKDQNSQAFVGNNTVKLNDDRINFFDRSGVVMKKSDTLKKENDLYQIYVLRGGDNHIKVLEDDDGMITLPNGLQDEDYGLSVNTFSKSIISRAITLNFKTLNIVLGNTGVCDDIKFFYYLEKFNVTDRKSFYSTYFTIFNREIIKNNVIQSTGRILRGFKINNSDNYDTSGRLIHIYTDEIYNYSLIDILNNIKLRSGKNLQIITKNG